MGPRPHSRHQWLDSRETPSRDGAHHDDGGKAEVAEKSDTPGTPGAHTASVGSGDGMLVGGVVCVGCVLRTAAWHVPGTRDDGPGDRREGILVSGLGWPSGALRRMAGGLGWPRNGKESGED